MNNAFLNGLLAFLIWPGVLTASSLSLFYLWVGRKATAKMQGRFGPPLLQPFYDFMKLMGKSTILPSSMSKTLYYGLPLVSVLSALFALVILPLPGNPLQGFAGDLILLLYLMEMPAFCDILAGYSTNSVYGEVSSARETLLMLGYTLPFLTAVLALAIQAGSFRLQDIQALPFGPVHIFAAIAFLLALPARLKSNPFSIPNAETEIVSGAHIEYNGPALGIFELAHGLELLVLLGLFNILFIPSIGSPLLALVIYFLVGLLLTTLTSLLAAATARIHVRQAFRFYWSWGALSAALAFLTAFIF